MLQHEHLLEKIGFGTTENEPVKVIFSFFLFFLERRRGVSKKTKKNTEEKKTQKEKGKKKIKERPFGIPELRRRARPLALPGAAVRDRCRLAERRRRILRRHGRGLRRWCTTKL